MPTPIDKLFPVSPAPVSAQKARQVETGTKTQELHQACRDFESLFVQQLLKEMRKTVPRDGLMNGGQAEQMYSEMLDGEMARQISNQGGIGLAPIIFAQASGLLGEKK